MKRHINNSWAKKNRKTKISHTIPRVAKDYNLKVKDAEAVNTYGVCDHLTAVVEIVSASHLLRKIKFKQTIEYEGADEKLHLEESGRFVTSKKAAEVAGHVKTDVEKDLSNIVKQNIETSKRIK